MKAYWESGGIAPQILNLGTNGGEWSASRSSHFTPKGKDPWNPLDRRLGGPQSWSGHSGEEKNSQPLPGFKPLIIQPIAQSYTPELSQFQIITILSKILFFFNFNDYNKTVASTIV
jgi:hypothetical protein